MVTRDGKSRQAEARTLVPGDIITLDEGDKVPADVRLVDGGLEVDLSMLTGESTPAQRIAGPGTPGSTLLQEPNLVFSGTACAAGQARAMVFATGDHTELGRIAALSQRTRRDPSPLEQQVKKVAWLIAAVAVAMGVSGNPRLVVVAEPKSIGDDDLDRLLADGDAEIVFARSSPETKLKVADALRAHGLIVCDDRRRRQRRPRTAPRPHRRGDGALGHRRRPRHRCVHSWAITATGAAAWCSTACAIEPMWVP
ncbi:hypothetical protein [Streptomyces sp. NPDC051000]|uniref:P-type ATPase n=1 Tax=Streptomyces sp. NPDC051000 TaxID=3155520 RepID=UPI0033D89104